MRPIQQLLLVAATRLVDLRDTIGSVWCTVGFHPPGGIHFTRICVSRAKTMKKFIATMLSVVVLSWAGIGCEGNPTEADANDPPPSADPAKNDDGGGPSAKPSLEKATKPMPEADGKKTGG